MSMSPRLLRPRASGFTPKSISGLTLWLDATQGVTLTGSGVSTWADQSGNSRDFTQTTAAQRPTYTATLNGLSVLTFSNAASSALTRTGIANADYGSTNGASWWIVYRCSELNTYTLADLGGAADGIDVFQSLGSGLSYPGQFRSARANGLAIGLPSTGTVLYGHVVDVSGNKHAYRRQSVERTSTTVAYSAWMSATNKTWSIGVGGAGFSGDIAETLIYSRPLNATEIASVESYLTKKWGIT